MENRIYSVDSAKAIKAQQYGYLNAIHYVAPASIAGVGNLCPKASAACLAACLGWYSGHASMVKSDQDRNSVRQSRIDKARRFMTDRKAYLWDVCRATALAYRKAKKAKLKLAGRLNGSTDIAFEGIAIELNEKQAGILSKLCARKIKPGKYKNIFELFAFVQWIDYTKNSARLYRALPSNYCLTLSYSGTNQADCLKALKAGHNVAVVFGDGLPSHWNGFPVIDGDKHDLRHLDPRGVVVGLSPKGKKAKADKESGFVVWNSESQALAA